METVDEKVARALDQSYKGWYIEWADHNDLVEFVRSEIKVTTLKERTAQRIVHRVLHAALLAGVVTEFKA